MPVFTDSCSIDSVRNKLIETAIKFLGVKYKYGHSDSTGFDCSGFVKYVYGKQNIVLARTSLGQYEQCKPIERSKVNRGDLVFFITRGKKISHVGICLGNDFFIHATSSGKRISIDDLCEEYYDKRLVGFGTVF